MQNEDICRGSEKLKLCVSNKKVLRETARSLPLMTVTCPSITYPRGGGTPSCLVLFWTRGYPHPVMAGVPPPPWKGPGTSGSIVGWKWVPPWKGHGTSGSIRGWRYGTPPPWTDTCENSTFPHPSDAGSNEDLLIVLYRGRRKGVTVYQRKTAQKAVMQMQRTQKPRRWRPMLKLIVVWKKLLVGMVIHTAIMKKNGIQSRVRETRK